MRRHSLHNSHERYTRSHFGLSRRRAIRPCRPRRGVERSRGSDPLIDLVALRQSSSRTRRSRWWRRPPRAAILAAAAARRRRDARRPCGRLCHGRAAQRSRHGRSARADPRRAGDGVAGSSYRRRTMRSTVIGLLMVQLIGVAAVSAQTADEVQIAVNVFEVKTDGAEQPAGGALPADRSARNRAAGPVSQRGTVAVSRSRRERKDRSRKAR